MCRCRDVIVKRTKLSIKYIMYIHSVQFYSNICQNATSVGYAADVAENCQTKTGTKCDARPTGHSHPRAPGVAAADCTNTSSCLPHKSLSKTHLLTSNQ